VLADLDLALALYHADAWALNNRGLARLRLGERDEAMENFRGALEIEPELPAAKKNLELVTRAATNSTAGRDAAPIQSAPPGAAQGEPAGPRP